MQVVDGVLVVSPTDLTRFAACRHLTALDLEVAYGRRAHPPAPGEELELLFARGLDHEAAYLQRLKDEGRRVVEIPVQDHPRGADGLRALEELTVAAMRSGADVVYQATFFDGTWRGHADFLLRRDDLPGVWGWGYDVADTKLARRLKVPAVLQMAMYAERLTELQGVAPEQLVVVTGDGVERAYRFDHCAAYARVLRAQFLEFVDAPGTLADRRTTPEPVQHCKQCRWESHCTAQWRAQDDLSLVAGMRRNQARALRSVGVTTTRQLALTPVHDVPPAVSRPAATRLVQQARLQVSERETGTATFEVLAPEPERGLALLPEPSPGDVFFDMEGDPFVGDAGLEYLFGVVRHGEFTGFWATEPTQEQRAFEALVDHLMQAWAEDPGMHVYHYAPYEPARLKSLSGRYDTRIAEVDRLLRGGRLVDLYAVVRQGLRISKESYSIKKLEDFYWGHGRQGDGVSDALGSVVAFERWLLDRDDAILEDIRAYNEIDCRSTQALRDWLEGVREQAGGDLYFLRPANGDGAPTEALAASLEESQRLRDALLAQLPEELRPALHDAVDEPGRTPEQQAVWLLAMLLDWHRREALPEWWEYFHRRNLTDEDLVADATALAGLHSPELVETVRRSSVWRMQFEPQDTKLGPGAKQWSDPRTGYAPTEIVDIRPDEGWLTFLKGGTAIPTCTALLPGKPIPATQQEQRLRALAAWVVAHGIDAPDPAWRAARDLLLRRPPRMATTEGGPDSGPDGCGADLRRPGEAAAQAVSRLASVLDGGVLPVQGPPGTGKTYAGARMVLDLIESGKRVGVCAFSHKAIGNLLDEICTAAAQRGVSVRGLQKCEPHEACASQALPSTTANADVDAKLAAGELDLVAGTAWLYARDAMAGAVDVLVVDEAGQLSLANVVAISHCATDVVLLGDPQQLAQPVKGVHPPGAQASALEHLLHGRATVAPDRGVLLDTTYRMHPQVAEYVSWLSYDGRLQVTPGLERQALQGMSALIGDGAGMRWVPVEHAGNTSACGEEADVVAGIVVAALSDGVWTDKHGVGRPVLAQDVLVLAPYNQQVHRVRQRLVELTGHDDVRVGTVDKYQGQEAPLVVYCLTSSSAAEAPRGVDFLLDPHRLTVAVSRARALAVVVGTPALLSTEVTGPEQLQRVNALCTLVDRSGERAVSPALVPS